MRISRQAFAWSFVSIGCILLGITPCSFAETVSMSRMTSEAALENMFLKMERDTLQFARKMEELLASDAKCSQSTLESCPGGSYHGCDSEFPNPECPGMQYAVADCGKGKKGGCGGVFDFTTSQIRISPDQYPYDYNDRVKDGVCSTLSAEEYMTAAWEGGKEYWSGFSVEPPPIFFGSADGVFRILPGSPSECNFGLFTYDPRIRPWYVGASSGPKDVILILDTSGSMGTAGRLAAMKKAAERVISTLNYADHFAVIEFNSIANRVGARRETPLQKANTLNKESVINEIKNLNSDGTTNFRTGFEIAFDVLKYSEATEKSSNCHQAILFLTDGVMSDDENSFLEYFDGEYSRLKSKGKPPVIFTYSFGQLADGKVPKNLACKYNGLWADIEDGGNLAETMGAYYKYFSLGLSANVDSKFVSWVEPYEFAEGTGYGTTASAPVYDRSVVPPILVGAVGLDFSFAAMEQAFGKDFEATKDAFISRIVEVSGASCYPLNLTDCQLQSLRKYESSDDGNNLALCPDSECQDTDIQSLKARLCNDNSDNGLEYPSNLWDNERSKGFKYEARKCCSVGEDVVLTDELVCSDKENATGLIIGLSVGGGVLVTICVALYCMRCRKKKERYPQTTLDNNIVVMPPPTAPQYQK